jgi:hypothetical protein
MFHLEVSCGIYGVFPPLNHDTMIHSLCKHLKRNALARQGRLFSCGDKCYPGATNTQPLEGCLMQVQDTRQSQTPSHLPKPTQS